MNRQLAGFTQAISTLSSRNAILPTYPAHGHNLFMKSMMRRVTPEWQVESPLRMYQPGLRSATGGPLPRREYTKRSDYQLINAENRQTITPRGWTHEQDNTKVIRTKEGKDKVLVREFGFNDYRRIGGFDFEPARGYWKDTARFWENVRARWDNIFATRGSVTLSINPADEAFNMAVLDLADEYRKNPRPDLYEAKLDQIFSKFVNVKALASVNGIRELKWLGSNNHVD